MVTGILIVDSMHVKYFVQTRCKFDSLFGSKKHCVRSVRLS